MGSGRSKHSENSLSYNLDKNKFYSNDISQSSARKLQTQSPLIMPIENTFKCDRCGMIFPTDEALFKHRTRFCIGIIDSSSGRKTYYSDDDDINESTRENDLTNRPTLRKVVEHQLPVEKKKEEINEWKNQRSIRQSVQDMEDRILRDSQKTQRLANDLKKRTHDYNHILTEYEQLQANERDLLREMFNLQGQYGSHSNQSNGITEHERTQLEILQRQNARLEQERRVIQNKLEELIASNNQSSPTLNYDPYKLLHDMKDEQDRNEKTLLYLRRRLFYPNSSLLTSSDILSLPYVNPYRRTTGNDIRVLPNGYLQSRRHDSEVLGRSSDLERRLRHNEYYPWLKDYPEPLRHYRYYPIERTNDKLILVKNENERLQNELDNMERKFQRLDSRTRQLELTLATNGAYDSKSNGYHSYSSSKIDPYPSLKSLNNTSPRQTYTNYDNNSFDQYYQSSLPTLDRHNTSHVPQSLNRYNTNMRRLQDPLAPQPYDPIGGFVIFFDFIINLPSNIEQCRLITCLHHSQSGLGEPSQLQPFKCELYVDETNGERMTIALIATKQPVPSCPPQQILTVVTEVQVITKQTPSGILRTQAWVKLPLFDHRNRLLSGRWKVPLKTLPILQDESFNVISTLPTYDRAELYYRLVNSQDAAEQTNVALSPNLRDLYFYPPQYRNRSYM